MKEEIPPFEQMVANPEVEIKIDRATLPDDGQRVRFQTQDESWHEGYFVQGDDLFWINENKWHPAFDILRWQYLDK
jgi:hypothetical protein